VVSSLRAIVRSFLFVGLTALLLPPYLLARPASERLRRAVARAWFRGACALCSLHLDIRGAPCTARPALLVANHVSYLDVPVLGSLVDTTFVAKNEVARWPVLGVLARLHDTVFVARTRGDASRQCRTLGQRLTAGDALVVFPEGTSSDGSRVLPFKSALFAVAERHPEGADLFVQPVSIAYTRYADGRPLIDDMRALYAWYGDMTLLDHLFMVFGLDGARVEVTFHEPLKASTFASRKDLARRCHAIVAEGVRAAHARPAHGPGPNPVPAPPVVRVS
jgi:1-acyl-sn-glycerol-3-phosphate acyltransferase